MPVSPGTRLGAYDVLAKLGEGGMGEVYRARDTKLGREVALKSLPEAFASDPDRLMRFEREARTLASLNHPNIANIHGLEESGGTRALVMELVEGEDLSARLARGPIPLDEALSIARQIAEALEAAHEAGIIHRDLKPANIKVRADGTVKVLDFGLAKALEPGTGNGDPAAGATSPTITTPAMTMRGVILGTAAYMSPEQAKGKPVDRRTDIWAFGCVLYEMLRGRRAFKGDDITDTITAVLRDEPDWAALSADTPAHVRALLRRCLVKDPKQRLRDIGDARLTLQDPVDAVVTPTAMRGPAARRPIALWTAGSLVLGVLSFAAARLTTPAPPPPAEVRFELEAGSGNPNWVAISPDGRRLAIVSGGQLWIRDMAAVESTALPGTEGASNPAWSPSAQWIAYTRSGGRLMRVRVDGSTPEAVTDLAGGRPAWLSDDELVFNHTGSGRLHRVPAAGGPSQPVFTADDDTAPRQSWPAVLPGSDHILFLSRPPGESQRQELRIGSAAAGTSRSVIPSNSMAVFAGPNRVIFVRNDTLVAQPFDPRRLEVVGEPTRVSDSITVNTANGRGAFDASQDGTIVFRPAAGAASLQWNLRELSPTGEVEKAFEDVLNPIGPALSPDGMRLAFYRMASNGGDVWILDRRDHVQRRFTFDPTQESASPVWSPDGRRIVFRARRGTNWALVEKSADGAGPETVLAEFPYPVSPMSWSPDGMHLLFMQIDPLTGWDIWQYSFADRQASPLLNAAANQGFPQFSPDGRWFAYTLHTSLDAVQTFVESFPPGRGKWQVPSERAHYPRWRADGRELFFLRAQADESRPWTAMAVEVRADGAGLAFGPPRRLFEATGIFGGVSGYSGNYIAWAVSGDGQRFFLQQALANDVPTLMAPLVVVMNHPATRPRE